jgi:hypothetical protein
LPAELFRIVDYTTENCRILEISMLQLQVPITLSTLVVTWVAANWIGFEQECATRFVSAHPVKLSSLLLDFVVKGFSVPIALDVLLRQHFACFWALRDVDMVRRQQESRAHKQANE